MSSTVTGVYPSKVAIQKLVTGSRKYVEQSIKQQSGISERHNAYTDYVLALLFTSTAHRPVIDPFQSLRQFDLSNGLLLVSDKVSNESRAWSLVSLPPTAVRQVEGYLEYLKKLSAWMSVEPNGRAIAKEINNLSIGDDSVLPLFFYLNETAGEWRSIKPGEMEKRLTTLWSFPINFLRHIAATELTRKTQRADWAQIQLGHTEGIDHHFGRASTESVIDVLPVIGKNLNDVLTDMGWQYVKSPIRMTSSGYVYGKAKNKIKKHKLGHEIRADYREKRKKKASALIRRVVSDTTSGMDVIDIDDGTFSEMLEGIILRAEDNGLTPNYCLRLFYRFVARLPGGGDLLRRVSRIRVVEPEASPFSEETLVNYRQLRDIRERFLKYLDDKGRKRREPRKVDRLSEIVAAASLFSGLASERLLEQLIEGLSKGVYQIEGMLFVDIPLENDTLPAVWRWYPDPISASLIIGLHQDDCLQQNTVARSSVVKGVGRVIKQVAGVKVDAEKALQFLSSFAKSGLSIEKPGYVTAVLAGDMQAVSLPLNTFVRIIRDETLRSEGANTPSTMGAVSTQTWAPMIPASTDLSVASQNTNFLKQIQRIIREAYDAPPDGRRKIDTRLKEFLCNSLMQEYRRSEGFSSVEMLIVAWAVHLCKKGTRQKKKLAYSTVAKYIPLVAKPITKIVKNNDYLAFSESAYEELYISALMTKRPRHREYLAGRLREFHEFLSKRYAVESPDWSGVMASAGVVKNNSYADANYITQTEYVAVLTCIRNDNNLSPRKRGQYAFLWFLGYRFGMRFGECWSLLCRDIQYDKERGEIYVLVRENMFDGVKTIAGIRVIPLIEALTLDECQFLDEVLGSQRTSIESNYNAPLMSVYDGALRLIDRDEAVIYLHDTLRVLTGDNHARFHHLRHSWATRMVCHQYYADIQPSSTIVQLLMPENIRSDHVEEFYGGEGCRYPLKSISTAIGHAGEGMTISGYSHSVDLIAGAINDKQAPTMTDYAYAYSVGTEHATIRRRRSRNKNSNGHDLLVNKRAAQNIRVPDVRTKPRSNECPKTNNSASTCSISLNDLENLLLRYGETAGSIDAVSSKLMIDAEAARRVIKIALKIERETGFTLYHLESKLADPIMSEQIQERPYKIGTNNENKRIAKVLDGLRGIAPGTEDRENTNGLDWLKVWSSTFNPSTKTNLVTEVSELSVLTKGFEQFVPSIKYIVRVDNDTHDESLMEQLSAMGYKTELGRIPRAMEKSRIRKTSRVEVKLVDVGSDIGTIATFHRLCFILSVAAVPVK